ncbi:MULTISPECIES: hypothetical protein [Pantoea]|uniref:hypothetical protein n=1 Tax=Pantoea TaxID=53335 RepID=UPI0013316A1F|nr:MULTISPECIES: hypothetical protein [Pantoea]
MKDDDEIGMILSASKETKNEMWPPKASCDVLESAKIRVVDTYVEVGVYNHRGVTVRMPHDGGGQE